MSDRLEEIKKLSKDRSYYTKITVTNSDVSWLISKLEQSRDENKEIQAVFDLQETRTKKAEKMWQQATGKHSTLPDLGVLLDWLMGEVKHQKSVSQIWYDSDKRQRRHRKWALKEMKDKQALWRNYCGEVSEWMDKLEQSRAEVKRLNHCLLIREQSFD